MRNAARHFSRSGLLDEKGFPEFRSAVRQALRVRDSFLAGLTTAVVVIPKAMAIAAIASLPVEVGL